MLALVKPIAPDIFALAGPGCVRGECSGGKDDLRKSDADAGVLPETGCKSMSGKLIVLEGLDGSGKTTQMELLEQ